LKKARISKEQGWDAENKYLPAPHFNVSQMQAAELECF